MGNRRLLAYLLLPLALGCGSSPTAPIAATPDFALTAAPTTISLMNGGPAQAITVAATTVTNFSSPVTISLGNLPTGVTASPATISVMPGQLGQILLTASGAPVGPAAPFTVTGTSGALSHSATASLAVTPAASPDFSISAAPAVVMVMNGGPAQAFIVAAAATNGFASPINITLGNLPAGVTASPATLSITPGQLGQFLLTASGAPVSAGSAIAVTGTFGTLSHAATATLAVSQSLTTVALSTSSFDFGNNLVGSTLTQQVLTVTNTGSTNLTLNPTLSGDPSYSIVPGKSCGATLAASSTCVETINYTPTVASGKTPQAATLNLGLGNVSAGAPQTVALSGTSAVLAPGIISTTSHPQVAQYSITLPYPGSVTVNFGTDTTYGRSTWSQSTTVPGQQINMLVAGMLPLTAYHMQAVIQLANGLKATDVDHTFNTQGSLIFPKLTVDPLTPGLTPQSGVEELTFVTGSTGLAVTDLQGNVLWSYDTTPVGAVNQVQGAKLMANGHFLVSIGQASNQVLLGAGPITGQIVAIREIDLAGNIVREISVNDLTAELQATGHNVTLQEFHHDVTPLPNGHWLVLSNSVRPFTNLPGYPGVTNVLGDIVIDLDQNLQPVWVWDEFDHFDVNRHPYQFPDWTHSNAVIYSPSDGNIIVSMRHQNWVVKVDYLNGTGAGDVLWRLGEGGDFTLGNGVDPTDWQYAQHAPSLFTPNSSGSFSLGMMDNGDDRIFPAGVTCGAAGAPACQYTTIPVFQIDEGTKVATLGFHQILPTPLYSFFGGDTFLLANGNIEYDLAGIVGGNSDIYEVTPASTPQTVWHMHSQGSNAYRGYRIPSLYPGVQW